jgi:mannose-1-phosphate guanylyltransferase
LQSSLRGCTVFILAGGKGTRIRSLFPDIPKPLIPIQGKPFLEWQIQLLVQQGFQNFVLCTGYLAEQISNYFGDGSAWGANIQYSVESKPLGTGGALKHAARYFTHTSLLLNGDTYLIANYQDLIQQHQQLVTECHSVASLSLVHRHDTDRYGSVLLDDYRRVVGFQEKSSTCDPGLVNAGAYILEPAILDLIPPGQSVSLETDTLPQMIADRVGVYGIFIDASFIDMGTPDGFHQLSTTLAR